MNINIWLPISVFKVEYEVGSGRPVSDLDLLIMEAVLSKNEPSIDDLANIFHLPSRIIVEVTVTLARSNWITVKYPNSAGFIVTEYGKSELLSGKQPRYMNVTVTEGTIVKECILGQVCLFDQVFPKKQKKDEPSFKEIIDSRFMTIEEASSILRENKGEWIRSIDTPRLVSRGDKGIKVQVDLTKREVSFLPDAWKSRLEPVLVEKVAAKHGAS